MAEIARRIGVVRTLELRALRHQPTIGSCRFGGHAIWLDINAASEAEALPHLLHRLHPAPDAKPSREGSGINRTGGW
jgi:hypothetical protein